MATVIFYEKPGCKGNARQRAILEASGHTVERRDLRAESWTADRLRGFLEPLPVSGWFNPTAPKVAQGEIKPDALEADAALALLVAEPMLIRRPLMEANGGRMAGWDPERVTAWIGLNPGIDAAVSCGNHAHDHDHHHHHDHDHGEGGCQAH